MNTTTPPIKRRACVACTAAKAKCTPHGIGMCQRCARLDRSCTYLDLPLTRRKNRPRGEPSRVQVLERKIDQLMAQLDALTRRNGQATPAPSYPASRDSDTSRDGEQGETDTAAFIDAANGSSHGISPPTSSGLGGQLTIVDRGLLTESEAEGMLATVQRHFVPRFPFVLLAPDETATHLRANHPFLFLCILSATMGSAHPLRKLVTEEIMNHVTTRIIVRSERTLELLRGLLVHCAWYSYPAERYHPRLYLLIQICVSMQRDMGVYSKANPSLDEQRALLGTYWLSNSVFSNVGRPGAMKQDGSVDECLASLASTGHISDSWIPPFIQIQYFLVGMDNVWASMHTSSGTTAVQVARSALHRQLDGIRGSVERDFLRYPAATVNALRTEIKYAELRLEELSLREELWTAEPGSPVRTVMLMNLIQRCKELIQTITPLSSQEIAQMTITTNARICAAVVYIPTAVLTLLKLVPDQMQAVVDAADYPSLVTQLADIMDSKVAGMSAADKESDIVGSLCSKMRSLARCYPHQVRQAVEAPMPALEQDGNAENIPPAYGDLENMFPIEDIEWDALLSEFAFSQNLHGLSDIIPLPS